MSIPKAKHILDRGGVCILPTETVYGIACRANDAKAIDRIYDLKGRDFKKPLAVCVRSLIEATTLAEFSSLAYRLAEEFWPGPLTLVLPARTYELDILCEAKSIKILDKRCYSDMGIALRCPDIDWRESLLQKPLALTSANKSGEPDPTSAKTSLNPWAGYVLDAGLSKFSTPSTILSVRDSEVAMLREGALSRDAFAAFDIEWDS